MELPEDLDATHATIARGTGALGQIAAVLGIAVAIFVLLRPMRFRLTDASIEILIWQWMVHRVLYSDIEEVNRIDYSQWMFSSRAPLGNLRQTHGQCLELPSGSVTALDRGKRRAFSGTRICSTFATGAGCGPYWAKKRDWISCRGGSGAAVQRPAYSRYAEITAAEDLRAEAGFADGVPVIVLYRPGSTRSAYNFIGLRWEQGRLIEIRDFYYVPYTADEARFTKG